VKCFVKLTIELKGTDKNFNDFLNRSYLLNKAEKEKEYIKIANARIKIFTDQKKLGDFLK